MAQEVITEGAGAGWYGAQGDSHYLDVFTSDGAQGAQMVPYGLAMLNAFVQGFDSPTAYTFTVQRFSRSLVDRDLRPAPVAYEAITAADWNNDLKMFTPGYVRTFDYKLDCVMAPVVTSVVFGPAWWQSVRSNALARTDMHIGVLLPRSDPITTGAPRVISMANFYGYTRPGILPVVTAEPTAEN